jgi:alpha-tubulin suppressor-like RCC1 family protein
MNRPTAPVFLLLCSLASACGGDGGQEPNPPVVPLGEINIISAGDNSTCIANSLGKLFCWGANTFGQLGDGTQENRRVPVAVSTEVNFYTVRAGNHACGLASAGPAYCWGDGALGRLGDGSTNSSVAPVLVSGDLQFDFMSLEVGGSTCGLVSFQAYCWGPNQVGQLGTGDLDDRSSPTPVTGGVSFGRVSVGGRTACGVTDAGQTYCWGSGADGELGNGSFGVSSNVPVPVAGGLHFVWVSVSGSSDGPDSVCGITQEQRAYCWGNNAHGQLGDGTTDRKSVPTPVSGDLLVNEIWVGGGHTCARTVLALAYCWGTGGLLGTGNNTGSLTPLPVSGGLVFATLTVGAQHSCGRTDDTDELYCWGENMFGQLGDGTAIRRLAPVKVSGQDES